MTDATASATVLIVEDDAHISGIVADHLGHAGYACTQAFSGTEARLVLEAADARGERFDVVVCDLMLPGLPGEDIVRLIRSADAHTPIVVTSARTSATDKVDLLKLGADDYLVKPFSPRELVARARALLRRVHADSEPQREVLEFGELTIDVSGHKVLVNNEEIDLTASEFKLLTTLSRYPGRVYSRMELVEKVLGYDFEGYERTIDSHVKNLRAKIGDNPRSPKWLHTVHGVGYRFEDPTKVQQ